MRINQSFNTTLVFLLTLCGVFTDDFTVYVVHFSIYPNIVLYLYLMSVAKSSISGNYVSSLQEDLWFKSQLSQKLFTHNLKKCELQMLNCLKV